MKMDRKAEGSFAETMIAMMVVTIALAAFMGLFAYSSAHADGPDTRISTDFVKDLRIEDGNIVGVDQSYIDDECTRKGFSGMVITIETAGSVNHCVLRLGSGTDSDFSFVKGTVTIPCDDGTTVIANYEVVAFV